MLSVSVAMATYNGEKYINKQLDSILCQLRQSDEVIISDDGSTDKTTDIVQHYMEKDNRIRLIKGPKKGVFRNFENALVHCNNDIIFLSDQDDIWAENKVADVLSVFSDSGIDLVVHNATCFSDKKNNTDKLIHYKKGFLINILISSYWGCCMAFRKSLIQEYLPFNIDGIAHDQLIGLLAEDKGTAKYLDDILTYHRLHSTNVTKSIPLTEKIKFRFKLLNDFSNVKKNRMGYKA